MDRYDDLLHGSNIAYKSERGRFVLHSDAKAIEEERDRLKADFAAAQEENGMLEKEITLYKDITAQWEHDVIDKLMREESDRKEATNAER